MDKGFSPKESFFFSGKITYGYKLKLFGLFLIRLLISALAWPFGAGIQNITKHLTLVTLGIVPYLICCLLLLPWLTASLAAAYDSLRERYEETEVVPISLFDTISSEHPN